MRKLASVLCAVAVVAVASSVSAGEFRGQLPLFPTPAIIGFDEKPVEVTPAPKPAAAAAAPAPAAHAHGHAKPVELFKCVKYRDLDHIAPCAEAKLVKVLDPCWKPDPCACCQKPKCVYILICVPKKKVCTCCKPAPPSCCAPKAPVCCPKPKCGCDKDKLRKVTCRSNGKYTKYDYGKHRIEIRVKNGYIEVDYDN
jgi:hypothetical protein